MNKILIGLYEFEGPYSTDVEPSHQPGVLAIFRHRAEDLEILRLKKSDDVNTLWKQLRPLYSQWDAHEISMAIYYMPGLSKSERSRVLDDIFDEFKLAAA